jgi:deoxyribonucleoside regulator
MADARDMALLSVGGITTLTTSYRIGHLTETDRRSLIEAGAVGDVLYNFIDAEGRLVNHEVNRCVISIDPERLLRTPERVLVSGGADKLAAIHAALATIRPTTLITDEQTAERMLARAASRVRARAAPEAPRSPVAWRYPTARPAPGTAWPGCAG